eukprot:TRINITY_DN12467_c0_g2_i3.p6 TRINITY_DN12467_c0_g2~~TRINITY_DN12467_c0_g2_i3.p6  ORF type:complete len:111 (+),score=6.91 TRINITY_DN12467_c0_g2_i3:1164-1496(+)
MKRNMHTQFFNIFIQYNRSREKKLNNQRRFLRVVQIQLGDSGFQGKKIDDQFIREQGDRSLQLFWFEGGFFGQLLILGFGYITILNKIKGAGLNVEMFFGESLHQSGCVH